MALAIGALAFCPARPVSAQNPFDPATVPPRYERDRDFDVLHIGLRIRIDWDARAFSGTIAHTLTPLRDGLAEVRLDAGENLDIRACEVDGKPAAFTHPDSVLNIVPRQPLKRGKRHTVCIAYASKNGVPAGHPFMGDSSFHWVEPNDADPARRPGFWTQGEAETNRAWAPMYDYPNDFATSDVWVDCPPGWFVVGNGTLAGTETDADTGRPTYHWRMDRPHASYLLSLAGGEVDVAMDTWRGVKLYYVAPKGEGPLLPSTYGNTKDMLAFFSQRFGVRYPWPKYAQTATFDFGGGMENVTATTMGEDTLVDKRDGYWPASSINSHELAHQWFGDLVTCKDWSHVWLNEGFATYCEQLYMGHLLGDDEFDRERAGALSGYVYEARRYKRPIVCRTYSNPDALFDSHAYPKSGLVLHMLRRMLGDVGFFRSVRTYLTRNAHRPVGTGDLAKAVADTTGRNVEAFLDQWVYKPGHPVVAFDWTYDEAAHSVVAHIKQTQDTSAGTPVYDLDLPIGVIVGGKLERHTVIVRGPDVTGNLTVGAKPDAVLLDPDHDLLLERAERTWAPGERLAVSNAAPFGLDREEAYLALLEQADDEGEAAGIVRRALKDPSISLRCSLIGAAGRRRIAGLRGDFRSLLSSKDDRLRANAAQALGELPADPDTIAALRALVTEQEQFWVSRNAVTALAALDAEHNLDVFKRVLAMPSRREGPRLNVVAAIARCAKPEATALLIGAASPGMPRPVRLAALAHLLNRVQTDAAAHEAVERLKKDEDAAVAEKASGGETKP